VTLDSCAVNDGTKRSGRSGSVDRPFHILESGGVCLDGDDAWGRGTQTLQASAVEVGGEDGPPLRSEQPGNGEPNAGCGADH
jgi:hypothetical protein